MSELGKYVAECEVELDGRKWEMLRESYYKVVKDSSKFEVSWLENPFSVPISEWHPII